MKYSDGVSAWSTLAIACLTFVIVIVGYIQLRYLVHSHKLSTLSQYLVRYNHIIAKIPLIILKDNISLNSLDEKQRKEILQIMFDYWNLIAEEFMFRRRGWIDKHIWEGWERGLEFHIKNHSIFLDSWNIISKSHRYNRMLREFIDLRISCDGKVKNHGNI
ncbi:MAG: hypothetical protein PVH88_22750 [Ignavibacteria bacterium]